MEKKTCVLLWPQGGTMVTKNIQHPNRIAITRAFYIIVVINTVSYYHYDISEDPHITLAFREEIKCFYLFFIILLLPAKSFIFCFFPIPNPRKDK